MRRRSLAASAKLPIWLPVSAGKSPELNNEAAGRQPVSREKRRKWLSVSGNNRKSLLPLLLLKPHSSLPSEPYLRESDSGDGFLQPSPVTVPGPSSLLASGVLAQKHSSDETGPEGKQAMQAHCRQKETVIQPVLTPCFHSWSEQEGAKSCLESVGSSGNSLRLDLCLLIRGGFLGVLFTSIFAVFFLLFLKQTFLQLFFFLFGFVWR